MASRHIAEEAEIASRRPRLIDHIENHTPCPSGYLAWHDWAERMSKTHKQKRCPECGLWAIWIPNKKAQVTA